MFFMNLFQNEENQVFESEKNAHDFNDNRFFHQKALRKNYELLLICLFAAKNTIDIQHNLCTMYLSKRQNNIEE